ncbi:hypothetical protein AB3K78_13145 [Leucobacter sp. HNU]|uniref:hypothetical protein n=1 Tax=Leucobacter sp. HNU TaxID=3236805 RepID=UPI0037ED472B|nr:hypothetical protein [Candidatus Leucobacter sulfamidivorax]
MSKRNTRSSLPDPSVDLPIASISVDERGAMHVTYDGHEFPPSTPDTEWSRGRFGDLLDALSAHRTRTLRVEVHEYDGSVFTDIIHATRSERIEDEVPLPSATRRARHRTTHQLIEIRGSGFIPGEDVTVALTLSSAEGAADGTARAVVDLSHIADQNAELLLIGRISGVIVVERLQS